MQVRQDLIAAWERALREIPFIRRARVGRRITHGRDYEQLMRTDYEYGAVLDFDDVHGLKAYLEHPAHEEIGKRFFDAIEETLVYDFDVKEGAEGLADLVDRRTGAG
jgi:hypothetical protein